MCKPGPRCVRTEALLASAGGSREHLQGGGEEDRQRPGSGSNVLCVHGWELAEWGVAGGVREESELEAPGRAVSSAAPASTPARSPLGTAGGVANTVS